MLLFFKKNERFSESQPDFRSKSKFLIDFYFALFKTIFDSIENYSFVILTKTKRPHNNAPTHSSDSFI